MEPAAITEEVKKSNLRGPGRRRLPDRDQVVVHPQEPHRARSTSSSTPTRASRGRSRTATCSSAIPHALIEGMLIAARAIRSARRLRLHPRRVRAAVAPLQRGGEGGVRRRPAGQGLRHRRAPRRGRVHLRRRDRTAVVAGRQEGLAEDQASVPSHQGRLRRSRRSSTTWRRSAACRPSSRGAPSGSPGSAPRRRAARGCTRCPAA